MENEGMEPYASFDSCANLEIASCAYMCFVLWHVNIYNNVMFDMFYVICLCAACGTNFDAPSVHMACKDTSSNLGRYTFILQV